jgi:NDP-sugar pyrophosphorylase family protein
MLRNVVACILAGGEGKRLWPLTAHRAKPAVRFGGSYRLIDFPLSNCVNSTIRKILVFPQYRALSLERHLRRGWAFLSIVVGTPAGPGTLPFDCFQRKPGTEGWKGVLMAAQKAFPSVEIIMKQKIVRRGYSLRRS